MTSWIKIVQMDKAGCGSDGDCPTVYQDPKSGDFIVQGFQLDSAERDRLSMPRGEDAVRIPEGIVRRLIDAMSVK